MTSKGKAPRGSHGANSGGKVKSAVDERRLSDVAYQQIHELVSTQLTPGTRISEADLAADLGMSKTPVREALRRLQSEGLVEAIPRVGYLIPAISYREVREVFEVREGIEGCAARLATERISDAELDTLIEEFARLEAQLNGDNEHDLRLMRKINQDLHGAIMNAADNLLLRQLYDTVRIRLERTIAAFIGDDIRRFRASFEEHKAILTALRARDADEAERAVRKHIQSVAQHILTRFR